MTDNPSTSPLVSLSPPPTPSSQAQKNVLRNRVSFTNPSAETESPFAFQFNPAFPASSPLQSPSSFSEFDEEHKTKRGRSTSLLSVHEVQDNYDDQLDQGVGPNLNADWVDYKGAWVIHIVLIFFGKILVDIIPGITQDVSWTTVNIAYDVVTYIMFHYVTGTPFESSGGVYDRLTMWEQIDTGAHYTPTKKWLTILPAALFLLCTHYTRLDLYPFLFALNFASTLCLGLLPKLPVFHRLRFRFLEGVFGWSNTIGEERSGPPTPIEEQMKRVGDPDFGSDRRSIIGSPRLDGGFIRHESPTLSKRLHLKK
ncbi:ORMDL family-domain-containing protein [Melampsora americana]|nr:ORMDL family-domain-containing protein [Melampsora americana]